MRKRLAIALGLAAAGFSLAGCADDLYGPYGYGYYGVGYGYGPYDYGYGYGPYYGAGYGMYDPFGWYGDFYYPGVGVYVYDTYRRPHHWDRDEQRYWSGRRTMWQNRSGSTVTRGNWSGFSRGPTNTSHWHHG